MSSKCESTLNRLNSFNISFFIIILYNLTNAKLKVVELFAGVGGFRIGLEKSVIQLLGKSMGA